MVKKDQSALRRADPTAGRAPDAEPRYTPALAQAWFDEWLAERGSGKPMSIEGRRWRASWAGGCLRNVAYEMHGDEMTNPPTIADAYRLGLGSMVHDAMQDKFVIAVPTGRIEVAVDLRNIGLDGAASADVVDYIRVQDQTPAQLEVTKGERDYVIFLELKTVPGYKFKIATTDFKGPPEGPGHNHLVQSAVAALAEDADESVIGYLALENLSKTWSGITNELQRFTAEWTFTRAEFEPVARNEMQKVNWLLGQLDDAGGDPRVIPRMIEDEPGHLITVTNPATGAWQEMGTHPTDGTPVVLGAGKTWHCDYCWQRDRCIEDGA